MSQQVSSVSAARDAPGGHRAPESCRRVGGRAMLEARTTTQLGIAKARPRVRTTRTLDSRVVPPGSSVLRLRRAAFCAQGGAAAALLPGDLGEDREPRSDAHAGDRVG